MSFNEMHVIVTFSMLDKPVELLKLDLMNMQIIVEIRKLGTFYTTIFAKLAMILIMSRYNQYNTLPFQMMILKVLNLKLDL